MPPILFDTLENNQKHKLGRITLNRPEALNALNDEMFILMQPQLEAWEQDDTIKAVLIDSNNPKAFCAGGDIRAIYERDAGTVYFRREYNVNRHIFHYKKPYIALMNGITMGGGVGVSIHARYRIATSDLRFAMPETSIGFFPDVGVSYHLARLPMHLGDYLGLTGNSISAQDALAMGIVDQVISVEAQEATIAALLSVLDSPTALNGIVHAVPGKLAQCSLPVKQIAACFGLETIEDIVEALKADESEWAVNTLSQLQSRSPTSLKVTLEQLRRARGFSLNEVIEMDYHIMAHMLTQKDFYEGIRAAIIDKDKRPVWSPSALPAVTKADVARYFEE